MMRYDPRNNKYKGDMFMRKSTKQSNKHMKPRRLDTYSDDNSDTSSDTENGDKTHTRHKCNNSDSNNDDSIGTGNTPHEIDVDHFIRAKKVTKRIGTRICDPPRLCGDLSVLEEHMKAEKLDHNKRICVVCNEYTYSKCTICNVALHYFPKKGKEKGKDCVLKYHNDNYFGLCRSDCYMTGKKVKDWKPPTAIQVRENVKCIIQLVNKVHQRWREENLDENRKRSVGRPRRSTRSSSNI